MRLRLVVPAVVVVVLLAWAIWHFRSTKNATVSTDSIISSKPATAAGSSGSATEVYAHNLMLRKGPDFRVYVRWLRGQMTRAHQNVNPSFDDPDSFFLDIKTGVLRANVGDLSHYLNTSGVANSALSNISLSGNGDQVKLHGTLHKIVPLPIEMTGTIAALPDNRIRMRVTKISVMKIPVKGLLNGFHIGISDIIHPAGISGIQVSGNDIFFDPEKLLPPPHIRGQLSSVRIVNPDFEEIYGNGKNDVARVEQWRNFLRLRGGTLDFGKLSMHPVDLIMIDVSSDAWFDLDLTHYQTQLVNGYTRMTPDAGLQIFMPDLSQIPQNKANRNISIQWLKNRNAPPPADVVSK
ncbi:MAG TPA: hypothetical protein VGL97_13655 [Bryobacteraceae bacterium]|jgi:hypothetical protein